MFKRTEGFKEYIKLYPVTASLIAINLIIYLLTLFPTLELIIKGYGIQYNAAIANGEYWRIFTAMFLHADFFHVFMNMFWLFIFGPDLEKLVGKMRYFNIYMVSGLVGNIATYLIEPADYLSLGASGAIFGVFGAFGALIYYTRKQLPMLRQLILPLIAVSVIMTFLQPNINVMAHLGGLAGGFVMGLIYLHPKRVASWRKPKR